MDSKSLIPAIAVGLLNACGGSGSSTPSSGDLSIGVTDAPIDDATAVVIAFDGITIKPNGGDEIDVLFDEPQAINLLEYQGENRALLVDDYSLPSGNYNWIEIIVDVSSSYIENEVGRHTLQIPGAARSGLLLNRPFTIDAGGSADFTLDFDLRKSIHAEESGAYRLRPTIRIVDNSEIGTVSGSVTNSLITAETCNNGENNDTGNAVYLFSGEDQTAMDVQGSDTDPLASAMVNFIEEVKWLKTKDLFHALKDSYQSIRHVFKEYKELPEIIK